MRRASTIAWRKPVGEFLAHGALELVSYLGLVLTLLDGCKILKTHSSHIVCPPMDVLAGENDFWSTFWIEIV